MKKIGPTLGGGVSKICLCRSITEKVTVFHRKDHVIYRFKRQQYYNRLITTLHYLEQKPWLRI